MYAKALLGVNATNATSRLRLNPILDKATTFLRMIHWCGELIRVEMKARNKTERSVMNRSLDATLATKLDTYIEVYRADAAGTARAEANLDGRPDAQPYKLWRSYAPMSTLSAPALSLTKRGAPKRSFFGLLPAG